MCNLRERQSAEDSPRVYKISVIRRIGYEGDIKRQSAYSARHRDYDIPAVSCMDGGLYIGCDSGFSRGVQLPLKSMFNQPEPEADILVTIGGQK